MERSVMGDFGGLVAPVTGGGSGTAEPLSGTTPLPRLGLGTSPLGNLYTAVTDGEARAVIDAAWEAGVRTFDTAPHYGLGLAEQRLGAALADRPRSEFVLSTK